MQSYLIVPVWLYSTSSTHNHETCSRSLAHLKDQNNLPVTTATLKEQKHCKDRRDNVVLDLKCLSLIAFFPFRSSGFWMRILPSSLKSLNAHGSASYCCLSCCSGQWLSKKAANGSTCQ